MKWGVWLIFLLCAAAWAGQMSSHDYTGLKAKDALYGIALTAVTADEEAFLSGAQGPDTTGVVQYNFDTRPASLHRSVGDETHYDPKKAELALNVLDAAGTDPKRLAFAIGWISHYINDVHVHEVVNNYGGYFKFYARHHKVLEQLETRYIMCEYPDIENFTRSHVHYEKLGPRFADFIFDAYHKTYPNNELYDQTKVGKTDAKDKRAYFCSRFNEAASWSYSAHDEFYRSATYKPAEGKHRLLSGGIVFPNMPSFDDYDLILNGIEITDVKAGRDKLTCTVKVHDDRLYGRFLADWQQAADEAVVETRSVFKLISEYLAAATAAGKAAARGRLLAWIPSRSLDQPLTAKTDADFQPPTVFPGDQPYRNPVYNCVFQPLNGDGANSEVNGNAPALTIKAARWEGSEDGQVTLEIPVPGGAYPYAYTLKVASATKADFNRPDYYGRSWVQSTGSTETDNSGSIMVGDIIPVTLTLNAQLASLPGKRIWMMQEPVLYETKSHIAGAIRNVKTPFTIQRQPFGVVPGSPDFQIGMITGNDLLTTVEEVKNGASLSAKVQYSNGNPLSFGAKALFCVFIDHTPYSALDGAQAYKQWQAANKRAESIYALMEKKGESLSEAKKKQLVARAEKYQADLEKQGLGEGEIEKKMQQMYMQVMAEIGIQLTKEQKAILDAERAANANMELKCNYFYVVAAKVTLIPCRFALQKPAGWKDPDQVLDMQRSLTKDLTFNVPDHDLLADASGRIVISALRDQKAIDDFMKDHAGKPSSPITVGPFKGVRFHTTSKNQDGDNTSFNLDDAVLMKSGGFAVQILASANARGYRARNAKNEVVADGFPTASKYYEALEREIEQMITTFHLIPGKLTEGTK